MISEGLQDFLTSYCGADEDMAETRRIMQGEAGAYFAPWLKPELDAAIADQSVSPEQARYLMSRRFGNAEEVAEWLAGLRREWFG
ncbi:hypothetical protein F1D05_26200 [Kribbella qitaiheensis]|uniref:CdiI immunity protein domain-containing protein n=1 Tax=Kribbella qitaiheensis TaxID=1544730 RepID=A0A7G6X3F1_9ACTN|nr:hypothetical protein [Kribbella qitaiheensis]QNE20766.1 hypothetical protein F1D05_26200 [Kribbella qitaiheensis]